MLDSIVLFVSVVVTHSQTYTSPYGILQILKKKPCTIEHFWRRQSQKNLLSNEQKNVLLRNIEDI